MDSIDLIISFSFQKENNFSGVFLSTSPLSSMNESSWDEKLSFTILSSSYVPSLAILTHTKQRVAIA